MIFIVTLMVMLINKQLINNVANLIECFTQVAHRITYQVEGSTQIRSGIIFRPSIVEIWKLVPIKIDST